MTFVLFLLTSAFLALLPSRSAEAILVAKFFFWVQLFLVTFCDFEVSEWVFSVPGSTITAKKPEN